MVGPDSFSALPINAPLGNIVNIDNDKHEAIQKRFHLGLIEKIY